MSEKLIYSKLFQEDKVELSSEKVELESVDKLKNIIREGKGAERTWEDAIKWRKKAEEAFKVISDADGIIEAAIKEYDKFLKEHSNTLKQFEKNAKALGISPNAAKEYIDAGDVLSQVFKRQDSLNNAAKTVKDLKV